MTEWKKAGQNSGLMTTKTWNHETDKTITGIFMEMREVTKKDGKKSKLYVIKDEKGELVAVWGMAMLDRLMLEPVVGNEVKITFVEKSFNKDTGKYLNEYTVDYREVDAPVEKTEKKSDDKSEKDPPF